MTISDLPLATQALALWLSLFLLVYAVMCVASPPAVRKQWRAAGRRQRPATIIRLLIVTVATSFALGSTLSVRDHVLIFGGGFVIYGVAGVRVEHRLRALHPAEWEQMKQGMEVEPSVKKRIEGHIARSALIASIFVIFMCAAVGVASIGSR